MKACSLIVIFIFMCCVCKYTSVEIMPEHKRNILNFGYRINVKYSLIDFMWLQNFDDKCDYLNEDLSKHHNWGEYINNLKVFCE